MSRYDYYVIDLEATRSTGRVMFFGKGLRNQLTPEPEQAAVITEEFVNGNTEFYDNGDTTRAVLCSAVREYRDNLMELIHTRHPEPAKELIA
ncbi:hypothetical protein [Marinobacterium litorale]|uniref:hypothetical protein n=1 Tax=Marinobacterium litorale TaxID=404770 RepID=UPI000484D2C0|nr:hypothetical protein [Marinobacterium litorale]